jgi:hypothetical protein
LKKIYIICVSILLIGTIYLVNFFGQLTLPFQGLSTFDVIKIAEKSKNEVIFLGNYDSTNWFISKSNHELTKEILIDQQQKEGWKYNKIDGSGIFFHKNKEEKIIICKKWTSRYLLCQEQS